MQQLLGRADGISLRDVLTHGKFQGADNIYVHSCCSDYRRCQPGDVFIALVDAEGDGHDHLDEAIKRGAAAVVTERLMPAAVPTCIVPDSREAYGQLCQHLAGLPHRHLELIGVTGTYGKTVTALLMASVLEAARRQAGILCSLGYSDSEVTTAADNATPPPADLAALAGTHGRQRLFARGGGSIERSAGHTSPVGRGAGCRHIDQRAR